MNRINTLCENATLTIQGTATYAPAVGPAGQPPSAITIVRPGIKINAPAGITIDYTAAPADACMFRIFGSNVEGECWWWCLVDVAAVAAEHSAGC